MARPGTHRLSHSWVSFHIESFFIRFFFHPPKHTSLTVMNSAKDKDLDDPHVHIFTISRGHEQTMMCTYTHTHTVIHANIRHARMVQHGFLMACHACVCVCDLTFRRSAARLGGAASSLPLVLFPSLRSEAPTDRTR